MDKNKQYSLRFIFKRSQRWVIISSFIILFVVLPMLSTAILSAYSKHHLHNLGEILSEWIQPALIFQDDEYLLNMSNQYVQMYSLKKIEILDTQGQLIVQSSYQPIDYPMWLQVFDNIIYGKDALKVKIQFEQQLKGYLVIYPSSQQIFGYLILIFGVIVISLLLLMTLWLYSIHKMYSSMMQTLEPLTQTARLLTEHKAYSLRFKHSSIREFSILIDAFNQLLLETQQWHESIQKENLSLSHKAYHDELTKLPNRHIFYQVLDEIFSNPQLYRSSALIFLDNNKFKKINDTYGHQAGDAILQETANRLKSQLNEQDLIVRLGGDEFAIILSSITTLTQLEQKVVQLMACCDEPLWFDGHKIRFSFSIGVASSTSASSIDEWIKQADSAMYRAKKLERHWSIYFVEGDL